MALSVAPGLWLQPCGLRRLSISPVTQGTIINEDNTSPSPQDTAQADLALWCFSGVAFFYHRKARPSTSKKTMTHFIVEVWTQTCSMS